MLDTRAGPFLVIRGGLSRDVTRAHGTGAFVVLVELLVFVIVFVLFLVLGGELLWAELLPPILRLLNCLG